MTDRKSILRAMEREYKSLEGWFLDAVFSFQDADEDTAYEIMTYIQKYAGNINAFAAAYTEEMRRIRRKGSKWN